VGELHAQEAGRIPLGNPKAVVDNVRIVAAAGEKPAPDIKSSTTSKLTSRFRKQEVKPQEAVEKVDLNSAIKASAAKIVPRTMKDEGRDPFRPATLRKKVTSRPRENLSPLERFELNQLKVVGVVWDVKEPRAMVEDTAGLGYTIKVGAPIGANEGVVKAIHRNEIVVEEFYDDVYGARKKREVSMKLLTE
jgi:type IV pilus assembly protein PilP